MMADRQLRSISNHRSGQMKRSCLVPCLRVSEWTGPHDLLARLAVLGAVLAALAVLHQQHVQVIYDHSWFQPETCTQIIPDLG